MGHPTGATIYNLKRAWSGYTIYQARTISYGDGAFGAASADESNKNLHEAKE